MKQLRAKKVKPMTATNKEQSIRRDPFLHIGKNFDQRVNEVKNLQQFASQLLEEIDDPEEIEEQQAVEVIMKKLNAMEPTAIAGSTVVTFGND